MRWLARRPVSGGHPRGDDGDGRRVSNCAKLPTVLFGSGGGSLVVAPLPAPSPAIFAATIGLKQWDIKKVLAYSTVSASSATCSSASESALTRPGLFHRDTHSFFKALLFLGSGSVIYAMHRGVSHVAQP